MLLIDDIQFIIGKESTQEEFFHTFNALYDANKQIVISSDKPPKEMETLTERLRTRFEMGLTADIQIPTYETKMAILNKKSEAEGYNIPDDVKDYVATHIKSSIRELEGALTKLVAFSTLSHQPLTVEFAEDTLRILYHLRTSVRLLLNLSFRLWQIILILLLRILYPRSVMPRFQSHDRLQCICAVP